METKTTKTRLISGVVVSTKMKDTVVVLVSRYVKHPKYKKYQVIKKRYKAHNPGNTKVLGEKVTIKPSRPISKEKRFVVVE